MPHIMQYLEREGKGEKGQGKPFTRPSSFLTRGIHKVRAAIPSLEAVWKESKDPQKKDLQNDKYIIIFIIII